MLAALGGTRARLPHHCSPHAHVQSIRAPIETNPTSGMAERCASTTGGNRCLPPWTALGHGSPITANPRPTPHRDAPSPMSGTAWVSPRAC